MQGFASYLGLRIYKQPDGDFDLVHQKYFKTRSIWFIKNSGDKSWFLKGVLWGIKDIIPYTSWRVGKGKIKIWKDNWSGVCLHSKVTSDVLSDLYGSGLGRLEKNFPFSSRWCLGRIETKTNPWSFLLLNSREKFWSWPHMADGNPTLRLVWKAEAA